VATPHAVLPHALEQLSTDSPAGRARPGHVGRLRSGLLLGATAALTLTVLPGTASAVPGDATSPAQAAAMVADADHQLEIVTEELNEAKVVLERQQAAVQSAQRAAAEAQDQLEALDGQIRQLARSAYTSEGLSHLDVVLTSDSADELLHQMSTLDAIAGHTSDSIAEVALAADEAESAQAAADAAVAAAPRDPVTHQVLAQALIANGRYVDAHESDGQDFRLVTREAQNNDSQRWVLLPSTAGSFTIQQLVNARFVDAHEDSAHDFSVVTRPAQNNDSQRWILG
jgi:hypothetical protein